MAANAVQISSQRDNLSCTSASVPWGHTYMTSALGGGSPKSRGKERGFVNSVRDEGGEGPKIRKNFGRHIWKPPNGDESSNLAFVTDGSVLLRKSCSIPVEKSCTMIFPHAISIVHCIVVDGMCLVCA